MSVDLTHATERYLHEVRLAVQKQVDDDQRVMDVRRWAVERALNGFGAAFDPLEVIKAADVLTTYVLTGQNAPDAVELAFRPDDENAHKRTWRVS